MHGTVFIISITVALVISLVFGLICNSIVESKKYPKNNGFYWGFFLGIIGLIVCCCKPHYYDTYDGKMSLGNYNPNTLTHNGSFTQTQNTNVADELKKYKEMLDEGLITEEEFTAKKKQLLGI